MFTKYKHTVMPIHNTYTIQYTIYITAFNILLNILKHLQNKY